jgi:hypothetical protein
VNGARVTYPGTPELFPPGARARRGH